MIRVFLAALVGFAAFAYAVVYMTVPNEPFRYHNGDRSNLQKVRP